MKKFFIYSLYILNLGILVACWWYFSGGVFFDGVFGDKLVSVGKLMGIVATYQALTQLVLIGRVKWVEQVFGLDKLSRVHKWNGYAILGFIMLHVFLVTKGMEILNDVSYIKQATTLWFYWEDVFKALLAFIILLVTIVLSITIIRRKLKYEWWYWVHLLNYLAFILFLGHQLHYGMSAESQTFSYYWLALYIFAGGNILWFRFIIPLFKFYKYQFVIKSVEPVNGGVATSITITGKHMEQFNIQAGQFMIFRFLQQGFWYEAHPFSLSTGPNPTHIRLTAKNLGDFTAKLPNLKPGTRVLIDGPHGVFTQQKNLTDKYLLIAGGIGITPIRSLAESLGKAGKDVTILYSAKTKNDAVLLDELQALSQQYHFKLTPILDGEELPGFEFGRLDKAKLAQIAPDLATRDVYLCGPPPMMNALKTSLIELGLPYKQLHWERFAL